MTLPATAAPVTAPVESPSHISALVKYTQALVVQRAEASELKGAQRTRAAQACRDQAAIVLAMILQDSSLRSARVSVTVKATLRGIDSVQSVTVPCIDVVRAVAFGGAVVGSARLV